MTTPPEPPQETAATTDDVALTVRGVDHVSLTVTDLNVSARFYTEVLGFTVVGCQSTWPGSAGGAT